jgi:3-oxoadipate enol-lactonase
METVKQIVVQSGATLGYVDVGEGLPIVLIHGLFLDHRAFEAQITEFSQQARVIAIDIHGHGDSSALKQPITLEEMAEDFWDLVRQLGIAKAIWCGLSIGGMTSLRVAIAHPASVAGLLLLNTNAGHGAVKKVPSFDGLNAVLTLRFLWHTAFLKKQVMAAGLLGKTTLQTKPELLNLWVSRMQRIVTSTVVNGIEAVLGARSILDELSGIMVPTIVAGGQEDVALPRDACLDIHRRIKGSQLVKIDDCGHSSAIEQPAVVSKLLSELVEQVKIFAG